MELAKTVYFSDYPNAPRGRSGLTIPFPSELGPTFARISHLGSYALRELIGYASFIELERDAKELQLPTASYARDLILKRFESKAEVATERHDLQATFTGGRGSPLHEWYPFLEGYSPDFVTSILERYAPEARTILDPFCGSGTTALVGVLRGLRTFYAEVNPLCRLVTEAKLLALGMPSAERRRVSIELECIASNIHRRIADASPDVRLAQTYVSSFGASKFFGDNALQQVLRLRTIADKLAQRDHAVGLLFVVGVLRSLIPASLLIRRGDLRFRAGAELTRVRPLPDEVQDSLHRIASDLVDCPTASGSATLVSDDARHISQSSAGRIDVTITSPPYLNGTNYFRNTKIELWFLRALATKNDLREFRDRAITSGINDVTKEKVSKNSSSFESTALDEIVGALSEKSYDMRISLMVRAYFNEMRAVFQGIGGIMADRGVIAVDLGDSCYGDTWIPTDAIASELIEALGFERIDRIILRERQSRDGRKLAQTLQIFQRRQAFLGKPIRTAKTLPEGWKRFREQLPHQHGDMARRNWGNGLHSLCSYQGKLKPALANSLVRALLPRNKRGRLLDPFSGVGTIPLEAQLNGHTAFSFDISAAAVAITKAKVEPINADAVRDVLDGLERRLAHSDCSDVPEDVHKIKFNGPLQSYFHPRTFSEILTARAYFIARPPVDGSTALVFSALLHILHGNRPYALSRRSHPITPFAPTGPVEYRALIPRLRTKVEKSLGLVENEFRKGRSYFQDATAPWPDGVADLDVVITSPPFFDSTRFHTANWIRLWFAGWNSTEFQRLPASFLDERQKMTFDVYRSVFKQCKERLKPGGYVLIHLGKSAKCDMASELRKIAEEHLNMIDLFSENVEHCESHGIRDKGTVTHHQYLLLRR